MKIKLIFNYMGNRSHTQTIKQKKAKTETNWVVVSDIFTSILILFHKYNGISLEIKILLENSTSFGTIMGSNLPFIAEYQIVW